MTIEELVKQTDWPKRREDATADALIVHSARLAMATQAAARKLGRPAFALATDSPEYSAAMMAYLDALTAAIVEGQLATALVLVQKRSREDADELARSLYEYTEDGGLLSEMMFDYLNDRGVDAEAIWDAIEQEVSA